MLPINITNHLIWGNYLYHFQTTMEKPANTAADPMHLSHLKETPNKPLLTIFVFDAIGSMLCVSVLLQCNWFTDVYVLAMRLFIEVITFWKSWLCIIAIQLIIRFRSSNLTIEIRLYERFLLEVLRFQFWGMINEITREKSWL